MRKLLQRSECYVAFLDILGFQKLADDDNFSEKIERLLRVLNHRVEFDKKHHPYLKYIAISDTIIIRAEEGYAKGLLWKISQVQNALLKEGFATRGGLTFGEVLTHSSKSSKNIFGSAYINAYKIEKSQAVYPRVAISGDAFNRILSELQVEKISTSDDSIKSADDGTNFVNQFLRDQLYMRSTKFAEVYSAAQNRKLYAKSIGNGVRNHDPRVQMKWKWLQNQLTACLPYKEAEKAIQ